MIAHNRAKLLVYTSQGEEYFGFIPAAVSSGLSIQYCAMSFCLGENARGEVFLNAAIASASCLYARGRALRCEKPSLCRARVTVAFEAGHVDLDAECGEPEGPHAMVLLLAHIQRVQTPAEIVHGLCFAFIAVGARETRTATLYPVGNACSSIAIFFNGCRSTPGKDFNLDFEGGNGSTAAHLHLHLVGLNCHMARDGGQNLLFQVGNQVGAAERRAFVREQDLQPLARDRRGVVSFERQRPVHAALRPNSLLSSPRLSLGVTMSICLPDRRRAASI